AADGRSARIAFRSAEGDAARTRRTCAAIVDLGRSLTLGSGAEQRLDACVESAAGGGQADRRSRRAALRDGRSGAAQRQLPAAGIGAEVVRADVHDAPWRSGRPAQSGPAAGAQNRLAPAAAAPVRVAAPAGQTG